MVHKKLFHTMIINAGMITLAGVVVMGGLLYQTQVAPIENRFLQDTIKQEQINIEGKIQAKMESVRGIALMVAQKQEVIQSLKDKDRAIAIPALKNIQPATAKVSDFKTVLVHVIDANANSFIKAWSIDKFGELTVNPVIKKTIESKQAQINFGATVAGVGVLGVAPVLSDNGLLGAVTAYQGVGSITRELKTENKDWLLVVDNQALKTLFGDIPKSLADNISIGNHFRVAHNKWFERATIDYMQQHSDLLMTDTPTATLVDHKMVLVLPIVDSSGLLIGRHIFIKDADSLLSAIENETKVVLSVVAGIILLIVAIVGILLWRMHAKVINPLTNATTSIYDMIASGKFDHQIPIVEHNEIGMVIQGINQLSTSIAHAVAEVNTVVGAIASGDLSQRIHGDYVGDLNQLKQGVNASADNIANVMTELAEAMAALKAGDFSNHIKTDADGQYGTMLFNAADAMKSIHDVIGDINEIMNQMNEANFSARVNSIAQGDLLRLKNNVNGSMENTADVIHSIVSIVEAQALGDLTKQLPDGHYRGQFHDLKNAMTYSMQKVKETIIQAVAVSTIVNDVAAQVSQGSADLSGRVQQQAAALEQTSATMSEMASAVQTNTANARKVAELATEVKKQSGAGVEVMQQTINAMQSIRASSNKIADIVTLIDAIAFQTNLLALNAAVEAARAGEHGRGFAVVASEVRALAQKSAEAAKDIKTLIDDSVNRVANGTQLTEQSGEMLNSITGSIEQVANMIHEIAAASHEQSIGINQVHLAMNEIDRITQENAALVEETTAAAESLSAEAHNLREDMAFFNTGTH